jgi:hypothetical protein
VLGTIKVVHSGDAGVSGPPGMALAGADDVLAAPLRAPVTHPGRALAPNVTIDGSGRPVIVYQEKARPQAFSRTAPVYASVGAAGRRRLERRKAYEPAVRPFGPGAIAVWQLAHARWGVAIESNGRFRRAATPHGPGPEHYLGEDFNYASDLATGGDHAVLTWIAADGSVRVSEL